MNAIAIIKSLPEVEIYGQNKVISSPPDGTIAEVFHSMSPESADLPPSPSIDIASGSNDPPTGRLHALPIDIPEGKNAIQLLNEVLQRMARAASGVRLTEWFF